MATEGGTFVSATGGTFETAMPGTFVSAAGGTFETVMPGTFHSATGGTFETVLGGTIKPLPSSFSLPMKTAHSRMGAIGKSHADGKARFHECVTRFNSSGDIVPVFIDSFFFLYDYNRG